MKIFSTAVYHSFFASGKCNCLYFVPNTSTEKALQKFGFKIKSVDNGFDLFSATTTSLSNVLNSITQSTQDNYFEFEIRCNNPNFILFTALPINWHGMINFSSKDPKNIINNKTVTLNQTLEENLTSSFGYLKIYFNDLIKNLNAASPVFFEIYFTARATQWQYYLINKNAIELDNLAITGKGNIQFGDPEKVTIQTGELALLFTSNKNHIPLSENPKHKFDLVNKNVSNTSNLQRINDKVIIKNLPLPDGSRIEIIENDGQKLYTSPMYIYL